MPSGVMTTDDNWKIIWVYNQLFFFFSPLEERANSSTQWCWKGFIHISLPLRPALLSMPTIHATQTVPRAPWRSILHIHLLTTIQVSKKKQAQLWDPDQFSNFISNHFPASGLLQPYWQPSLCLKYAKVFSCCDLYWQLSLLLLYLASSYWQLALDLRFSFLSFSFFSFFFLDLSFNITFSVKLFHSPKII